MLKLESPTKCGDSYSYYKLPCHIKHKRNEPSKINELYKFTFTTYLEKGLLKCYQE